MFLSLVLRIFRCKCIYIQMAQVLVFTMNTHTYRGWMKQQ